MRFAQLTGMQIAALRIGRCQWKCYSPKWSKAIVRPLVDLGLAEEKTIKPPRGRTSTLWRTLPCAVDAINNYDLNSGMTSWVSEAAAESDQRRRVPELHLRFLEMQASWPLPHSPELEEARGLLRELFAAVGFGPDVDAGPQS